MSTPLRSTFVRPYAFLADGPLSTEADLSEEYVLVYWQVSAHTTLFNYTGHPAIVLRYGQDQDGLPIGVQLVGKRWDEARLLGIAQALTNVTGAWKRPPGY